MEDIYLILFYAATVAPTLLFVKETRKRLSNIKHGAGSMVWLPLTIGGLVAYVIFAMDALSTVQVLNWSWLGYNIALGPSADQGLLGVLPFVPLLVYMLIHVNYFEEF